MNRRKIKALIFRSTAVYASCSFIACAGTLDLAPPCHAADFSRAKQIYVPPSRIRRRFDFESLREREAPQAWDAGTFDMPPAMTPVYPEPDSSSKPAKGGKYGLIPPPPPMTPSLLPSGNFVVPSVGTKSASPAAPSKSVWSSPAQLHATQYKLDQKGSWSKSVSDGLQKLSQSPQVSSAVDRAQAQVEKLMSEGKLQEAEEMIKNYLKSFPKDKVLRTELAQTVTKKAQEFLQSEDCEAALKAARSALSLDGSSTTANLVLNEALRKKGVNAHSERDRLKQAELLSSQGKNSEALVEYKAALKIKSTAEGHIGVGNIYMREGKRDLAKIEYEEALQLEPSNWQALRQMGLVRYQLGDLVGANSDFSRALTINPHDTIASKNLIDLWQRQVSKNSRDVNAHLGLARAYQLTGDLKSAQSEYREVVRIDPEHPSLPAARQSFKLALARQEALKSFQAAHTLDSHGAVQEAYQKIIEAVGLAPTDTNIRMYQADLCRRLGYIGQAHDAYMAILKVEPKNELAAQRLKALQALNNAHLASLAPPVATPANALKPGGMATNEVMNFVRAPFHQPQQLSGAGTPAALPQPFKPAAPPDPVQNLGGFLSSLRDASLKEKQRMEKVEDAAQTALKASTGGGGSTRSAADLAALLKEETPILESPVLAGATATSAAQAAAPPAAQAAAADAGADGGANSLASLAMQALPALKGGGSKAGALAGLAPSLFGNGGKLPMMSGDDMDKVYQMLKGPIGTKLGIAPPAAPQVVTPAQNPPVAPVAPGPNTASVPLEGLQVAYQKLGSLEEQNKQLQNQLKQAQEMISALQTSKSVPAATAAVFTAPAAAHPQTVQQLQSYPVQRSADVFNDPPLPSSPSFTGSEAPPNAVPGLPQNAAASPAPATVPGPAQAQVPAPDTMQEEAPVSPEPMPAPQATRSVAPAEPPAAPSLRRSDLQALPPGQAPAGSRPGRHLFGSPAAPPQSSAPPSPASSTQSMTLPMAPKQSVRFELQGVSGSLTETKLKVVLRNDSDVVLKLPGDARVLVRLPGQAEKQMKVLFDGKEIAPRSEIKGTIKVQRKDLNPSADVYLPNILPANSGERGVHLTVPISSL